MNNQKTAAKKNNVHKSKDAVLIMVSKRRTNHSLLSCGDEMLRLHGNDEFRPASKAELNAGCLLDDDSQVNV